MSSITTILGTDQPVNSRAVINTNFSNLNSTKKEDSMTTNKLLGRSTASTGVIEEITLGTGLSYTGTTLNVTAWAGDVTSSAVIADNAIVRGDGGAKWVQSSSASIDDNWNITGNNLFGNLTSTVSAAGTTTLTIASSMWQRLTWSTTQTFQLPVATTLPLAPIFYFDNNSSQSLTITNAGAASQYVVPAGGAVMAICTANWTSNGTWDFHALTPASVTWWSGVNWLIMNSALTTTPQVASGASSATVPSFIPQRGASTTGFGWDGTNLSATIAGTEVLKISSTGITTTGNIELGHASDTTLSRAAAWVMSIEGMTINGYSTTATAAGTTTLTIASATTQFFTGSTTQTVTLPTTSVLAGQTYRIKNNSTGNVTVQSSGANTIQIIGAGMECRFTAIVATPTTAANWSSDLEETTGANLATTATANAATINLAYKTNTITNNSAATLTITLPTAGAIDGEMRIVRVLDFSAVAQTLTLVNTENSSVTPNASTNGSTTLPYTFGVQFNNATTKWRVIASA